MGGLGKTERLPRTQGNYEYKIRESSHRSFMKSVRCLKLMNKLVVLALRLKVIRLTVQ